MDTFCEQLITIKKTTADWLAILGYFALASLLSCVAIYFLFYFVNIFDLLLWYKSNERANKNGWWEIKSAERKNHRKAVW